MKEDMKKKAYFIQRRSCCPTGGHELRCAPWVYKDNKGFSLVELVIVVAIMAILVGILAPQYIKYVERSRKAADMQNLEQMVESIKIQAIEDNRGQHGKILFPGDSTFGFTIFNDSRKTQFKFKTGKNIEDPFSWSQVAHDNDEEALYTEIFGAGWRQTSLKSKKWTKKTFGNRYLWAVCYITPERAVEVKYSPDVEAYLNDEDSVGTK